MMTLKKACAIAAIAAALPLTMVSSGDAAPLARNAALSSAAAHSSSDVTQVQWRGRRGGWGPGVGIGLAAGALIGGAIAAGSAPYYGPGYGYGYGPGYYGPAYAPAPVYVQPGYGGGDDVAYCMQRYRSYDPASGTYLNYDGNRYPCP